MNTVLKLALSLAFLLLPRISLAAPGDVLWQDHFDREGNKLDEASGIAFGGGRVFAVGRTRTTAGGQAFSVRAYNGPNGALLWQDHFDREATGFDEAVDVAFNSGRVFVVGTTGTAAGGQAFSVRAYNGPNGALLWQDHFDMQANRLDEAVAVAATSDRVFAVGRTRTLAGGDAFSVRAYNATNGTLLWQNHFNREGALPDEARGVVVGDNRVFVVGRTSTTAGGLAFSVRAYNAANGPLVWQNHFDREGTKQDEAIAVAFSNGRVFVVGTTETTAGGFAFSVRVHNANNGAILWQDHFDRQGALLDEAFDVVVGGDRVFVVGRTDTVAGGLAFAVRAYNAANGTLLWQSHFDREGNKSDEAHAVAFNTGKVFVVGKTQNAAGGDAFAIRVHSAATGALFWQNHFNREGALPDEARDVVATADGVFVAGTTKTHQGGPAFSVRAHSP